MFLDQLNMKICIGICAIGFVLPMVGAEPSTSLVLHLGKAALSASCGSALDVIISEPLEYRKTMRQVNKNPKSSFGAHYSGAPASMLSTMPTAIVQAATEAGLDMILPGSDLAVSSGRALLAGFASSSTTTPSELLRLRLRVQYDETNTPRTAMEKARAVYALAKDLKQTGGGWHVLFRGITTKALREGIYAPGYMALYPKIIEMLQTEGLGVYSAPFFSAAGTAFVVTLATQPIDTISTRMQEDDLGKAAQTSSQHARELYRAEGIKGFYSGTSWRYLSIFISVCCMGNLMRWAKSEGYEGESRIIESD